MADDLVRGVVAADVFSDDDGLATQREGASGVDAAGLAELLLALAQPIRQLGDNERVCLLYTSDAADE